MEDLFRKSIAPDCALVGGPAQALDAGAAGRQCRWKAGMRFLSLQRSGPVRITVISAELANSAGVMNRKRLPNPIDSLEWTFGPNAAPGRMRGEAYTNPLRYRLSFFACRPSIGNRLTPVPDEFPGLPQRRP